MLASCVAALALRGSPLQGALPLRLKIGDGIRVAIASRPSVSANPFDGVYVVSGDGAIYGTGFGRIQVAGKPFAEAERDIKQRLKPYIRSEYVFVRLESQSADPIYLVGGSHPGRMNLEPGLSLRKVLPQTDAADWDLQEVELVRDGKRIVRESLGTIFRSQDPLLDAPLLSGDVVSIVPTESLRVWVAGDVARPGEMKMMRGSSIGQLLASAGGASGGRLDRDRRVRLRRGPEERVFAYDGGKVENDVALEAGDLVTVTATPTVKVTVAGEVASQGEYALDGSATITTALAKAGGVATSGSLRSISVFRAGEMFLVDATDPITVQSSSVGPLRDGDMVVVSRNERRFYVLGQVGHAGAFPMEEPRTYRLADAVAMAGGLDSRGVMRRITVVRAGADGKMKPTQYNLDEFLKDGKLAANPVIEPGDAVYVGTSRGLTLGAVTQAVSGALLLESLGARR